MIFKNLYRFAIFFNQKGKFHMLLNQRESKRSLRKMMEDEKTTIDHRK